MDFKYFGANCIGISTKQAKIMIDPLGESFGVKVAGFKPDLTLITNSTQETGEGEGFVINSPGEYEAKGVSVYGIPARKHTDEKGENAVMYKIIVEGMHILVSGLVATDLSDDQKERVDHVDVLFVPVGGKGLSPDAKGAAAIVNMFEPSVVIPTHYEDSKVKYEVPQDGVDAFIKELGEESEPVEVLKLKKQDIDTELIEVKVLKRS